MKVLLSIFSVNEKILHIQESLESIGCEVKVIYSDAYRQVCPYYMKKLDELGFHSGREKFLKGVHDRFHKLLNEFRPDIVLFINTPKDILTVEDIQHIKRFSKTICWFVDGISDHPEIVDYIKTFQKIYVFEYKDVDYLNGLNIKGTYLPVGYNDAFSNVKPQIKEYDILFIGSPFHNRLKILEDIAYESKKRHWNLKIMGPFYDMKYPWKKIIFKRKYPYVYHFLENRRVSSEEAAELYAKTKVCINIHDPRHKSPNPRTFEILAAGSFELIDKREYYGGVLSPHKDIVEYFSIEDLIEKLEVYLRDNALRERIATNGQRAILRDMNMKNIVKQILSR